MIVMQKIYLYMVIATATCDVVERALITSEENNLPESFFDPDSVAHHDCSFPSHSSQSALD